MWEKPIGIFDSGLGGLTALKEISRIMPNEDIVYLGDTGRAPYGDKDDSTLKQYAKQDLSFLESQNVKIILAACGTLSSLADFSELQLNVRLVGVIESACDSAVKVTKNGKIGIIGTSSTINSGTYKKKICSLMPNAVVYQKACPMFVPLIESGNIDCFNSKLMKYAKDYLSVFKELNTDTIILGCTHYPLIETVIRKVVGSNVNLINSGEKAAELVFKLLKSENKLSSKKSSGKIKFFISGEKEKFLKVANSFLENDLKKDIETVNICKWGSL